MRRTITYPYLILAFFLFGWIHLPKNISDGARSFTVASFGQFLNRSNNPSTELLRLQVENQNLRSQIDHAYDWLLSEHRMKEQIELLKELNQGTDRSFFQKRAAHLRTLLQSQLSSFPAQVIYRDPSSWSSSLWVGVGEENNRALGQVIIAKNSPVLADGALVGVVDYVGKKQSRVRLITDSGLSPSVRAVRGFSQNRELAHQLTALLAQLEKRGDLFASSGEKEHLFTQLTSLKKKMGNQWEDGYLAKGEVHGSSAPFWRSRGPILKGVGFNFDYPDDDGPARDLKTGCPLGTSSGAIPILKEGDLLVTSGLDGIFPPGIRVGTVALINPLKEGGYAYEIEVRPSVTNLNDLQTLFILPPLSE